MPYTCSWKHLPLLFVFRGCAFLAALLKEILVKKYWLLMEPMCYALYS